MKCKHCGKEFTSKRKVGATTCSDKCRQARRRQLKTSVTNIRDTIDMDVTLAPVTDKPVTDKSKQVTLEHYYANPDQYATRARPQLLNWGEWMTTDELVLAGFIANRVSIPGDWDYDGVIDKETMTVKA